MTYAPRSILDLGAYWTGQGGVMLGIVGDANHTSGYHLGRDRIYDGAGPGQGADDYSVKHPRDRYGLSGAASAIDLGKLGGTYEGLQDFSNWLVRTSRVDGDIREIIYSPDGEKVQRWSGIDGEIHTGPGNGDASHRTHTHISYFRDSEYRDKTEAFSGYWEADMAIQVPQGTYTVAVTTGTSFYADADCRDRYGAFEVDASLPYVGAPIGETVKGGARAVIHRTGYPYPGEEKYLTVVYVKSAEVGAPVRVPEPVPVPPTAPTVLTGDDGSEYRRA